MVQIFQRAGEAIMELPSRPLEGSRASWLGAFPGGDRYHLVSSLCGCISR